MKNKKKLIWYLDSTISVLKVNKGIILKLLHSLKLAKLAESLFQELF